MFVFSFPSFGLRLTLRKFTTGATTSQYTSAHNSDSAVAARKIAAHFSSTKNSQSVTILLQQAAVAPEQKFLELIEPVEMGLYNKANETYGYDVLDPCIDCFFRGMQSYWRTFLLVVILT